MSTRNKKDVVPDNQRIGDITREDVTQRAAEIRSTLVTGVRNSIELVSPPLLAPVLELFVAGLMMPAKERDWRVQVCVALKVLFKE